MWELRTCALDVPGAKITYDVIGDGPPLMFLGSPMDASGFRPVAAAFIDDFTVITYDPRGLGRSVLDEPESGAPHHKQAEDVSRVLQAVGLGPAAIFGSSGGAVTGLALAAAHPDQVGSLVAHEPPLLRMLHDPGPDRANRDAVVDAFRSGGVGAGMTAFLTFTGMARPDVGDVARPTAEEAAGWQRTSDFLLRHMVMETTEFEVDLDQLRTLGDRLTVGVGAASVDQLPRRTAEGLATRLGLTPIEFPGGHTGFLEDPTSFAARLRPFIR